MLNNLNKVFIVASLLSIFCFQAFAADVSRIRTIDEFFRENTNLRISEEAVREYQTILNDLTQKVLKQSEVFVAEDERKTIKPRDIVRSSDQVLRRSPLDVPEIMQKIKQLSIIELARLTSEVSRYSESLLESEE